MFSVRNCCCCFSVRTGSWIIFWANLISAISIGARNYPYSISTYPFLSGCIIKLFTSLLGMYGLRANRSSFLLPYIICQLLLLIAAAIYFVASFVRPEICGEVVHILHGTVGFRVSLVTAMIVSAYCLMVVKSCHEIMTDDAIYYGTTYNVANPPPHPQDHGKGVVPVPPPYPDTAPYPVTSYQVNGASMYPNLQQNLPA